MELDGSDLGLLIDQPSGVIVHIGAGCAQKSGCRVGDQIMEVNGREPGEDDSVMPWVRLPVESGVTPRARSLAGVSVRIRYPHVTRLLPAAPRGVPPRSTVSALRGEDRAATLRD